MAETILVTGATGKVGERLVPRLLSWREPGDEIRVLVRTVQAAARFEAAGARAVVGDLTEEADRKRALGGCDHRRERCGDVSRAERDGG